MDLQKIVCTKITMKLYVNHLASGGDIDLLDEVVDNGQGEDDRDEEWHCKHYREYRTRNIQAGNVDTDIVNGSMIFLLKFGNL